MFIILEGIDKTGKTSLANHLSKMLNLPIIKFSAPKGDPYIEYMNFLLRQTEPAILDRFYMGEQVYGPVYRGENGLTDWKARNIEMLCMMRGVLPIYSFTSYKDIIANFKKENETFTKAEDVEKLEFYYNEGIDKSELTWRHFNYNKDGDYEGIDKVVLKWYEEMLKTLHHKKDLIDTRTLGNYNADLLILGEISNIELEQEQYKRVNVGFANGPSADMLYGALKELDGLHNVAISNVYKAHMEKGMLLDSEITLPKLKKILVLGNKAKEGLDIYLKSRKLTLSQKVIKTYHPSYALRKNLTIKQYADILRRALK